MVDVFAITDTPDEIMAKIGKRLSDLRLSRNWTQLDLAQRAGVSKRSVERLESGVANPQLDVFVAVCVALGLTGGFESLLPAVQLAPQQIFKQVKLPRRSRTRKSMRKEWGNES